jgi:crotonobetainyl-CoA:carnitine CoA-transferase CaiB-like acyl-CoA transferase
LPTDARGAIVTVIMAQQSPDSSPSALDHLRVVEIGGMPAAYATSYLGGFGADVIKVEPPGGDPARLLPPFAGDIVDRERGIPFLNANVNKRSIALDISNDADARTLRELLLRADIVIESTPVGELEAQGFGPEALRSLNPGLVVVSMSPFGQWGPYAGYRGNDAVAAAMSGFMTNQGDDERSPVVPPCQMAYQLAAVQAAYLALAGVRHKRETGRGQVIDLSLQEALTYANVQSLAKYSQRSEVVKRPGREGGPFNIYRARDGRYVFIAIYFAAHWQMLTRDWMQDDVLSQPEWDVQQYRIDNVDVIQMIIGEFIAGFDADDFVRQCQERGIACTPVNSLEDLTSAEQLTERDWFWTVDHPVAGSYKAPGAPLIMSRTPYRLSRPAPLLDQHRAEILSELQQPVPDTAQPATAPARAMLDGIRIADITRVFVGPIGTQLLGFYGAQVIKVESADLPANRDPGRGIYPDMNRNKLSCTIDLRNPGGKELFRRLATISDVVVDNFSAGVMGRLSLGYDELREVRPDIIRIGMPGMGSTGPQRKWVTYGNSLQAFTGLVHLWGHPDSPMEAHAKGTTPDYVGAVFMGLGALAAIEYRDRTGEGQELEVSMLDGQAALMGPAMLDYTINGRSWGAVGNDEPLTTGMAPYGCYPCRNPDTWIVITCEGDDDWQAMAGAMRQPPWAADARFATHEGRREHRAEMDGHIAAWTSGMTPHQALRLLQKAGVAAGIVMNSEHLYMDPHLRARGHLVEINEPPWGTLTHQGLPGIPSVSPAAADGKPPWPGDDNAFVFGQVLGLSEQEITDGESSGAIH